MAEALGSTSRGRVLARAVAVMIAGLIGGSGVAIWMLRQGAIAEARDGNHRLGVVLAEETARTLQAADSVLVGLAAKIADSGAGDVVSLHERFGGSAVHDALAARLVDLPQTSSFVIFDSAGHFVNDSAQWPVPEYSNATRAYMRHFLETADAGPFISEPVTSRSLGIKVAILARRITASNGTFLGVVIAPIRIDYFDTLLARAGLSAGSAVSIVRTDGLVLVHFPASDFASLLRLPLLQPWYQVVAAGGGDYVSPGQFGGMQPSFVSVHPLQAYPVVVDTARSEAAALARWRTQAIAIAGGVLLATLCLTLLLRALLRQIAISEISQAQIGRQVVALRASEARLATTLEHMNQGLIMVGADGRVAVCNMRAMEILELPADVMAAHPRAIDLIDYQRQRGEFAIIPGSPLDTATLLSSHACYERRRPNGIVVEVRTAPLPDGGMVRTYSDVTARAAAEAMLSLAASHDQLTGLANRNGFSTRLDAALSGARRDNAELAVLCLDLDRFKAVNDTLGHGAGDQLLIAVAQRMREVARGTDIICRLGGDEFAVVLPGSAVAGAEQVSRRLLEKMGMPFVLGAATARIGVSVGIAMYPGDGVSGDELLRNADAALYKAKAAGRNTWCCFAAADGERAHLRMQLEQDFRSAVECEQFSVAYQPICDANTGEPVAFEALLRWSHPTRGAVPPVEFISIAEQTGLIGRLGRWVIEVACAEAAAWAMPVSIAINMSPAQFQEADLPEFIGEVLSRTGLPANRLELEVTEGLLLEDADGVRRTMDSLRATGVRMVLDDFGTAHSNLSYLRGFPFDAVKIDRSFLRALSSDQQARALVEAMLAMARALDLDVIGEGVETEDQLALLRLLGCRWVQGYLLGRPVPSAETREAIWKLVASKARGEKAVRGRVPAALG